jgi:hypothetical protein
MNTKSRVGVALAVLAGLTGAIGAGPAGAACPVAGCGGGGDPQTSTSLSVSRSDGTVTGGGIDCGATCTKSFSFPAGEQGPAVTLTASGGPSGFAPTWTGCDAAAGSSCDVDMTDDHLVHLGWVDVTDPQISGLTLPAKTADNVLASAWATDNAGVAEVVFAVDGVEVGSDTSGPPFQVGFGTTGLPEGTHHLSARAYDTSNRASTVVDQAFVVDRSTHVSLGATPASGALVNAIPALGFTADTDGIQSACRVYPAGSPSGASQGCASPYAPAIAADGDYVYEVRVVDNVNNSATATRAFTLDRTAPALAFTDGPDEGATVATPSITIRFATSDAHPGTVTCTVDGGAAGPCTSADSRTLTGLTDGTHTMTVLATDAAGNPASRTRTFAVALPKPATGDGGANAGQAPAGSTAGTGTGTGTGADTGGTQGGTPAAPGGDAGTPATGAGTPGAPAAPPALKVVPRLKSERHGARTAITQLKLAGLPAGTTLTVACTGGGCPFTTRAVTVKGGAADLSRLFTRKLLKAGAKVRLTVTAPVGPAQTITIAIVKGKAPRVTSA